MSMVLVRINVSQPMLLLIGGVDGTGESIVESKLLEWLRSSVASRDGLLSECDGVDSCWSAEDGGGGTGCLMNGGVALASDPTVL
jgi:hypothetical protein